MSGIGAVGGPDRQYQLTQNIQTEKKEETVQSEPKDKIQLSRGREVFEKIVGSPAGLVLGTASTAGGFISGGLEGAGSRYSEPIHYIGTAIAMAGMGAAAGSVVASPVIGGIIGGAIGLGYGLVASADGAQTAVNVATAAGKAVSDNVPTDSKVKDAARNFTEGGLTGAAVGAVGGFTDGTQAGAGIVSGVIEGAKGAASAFVGKYEKPAEEKPVEGEKPGFGKRVLNAVLSAPRVIAGTALGLVGGVAGMGMEAIDGAIQGAVLGFSYIENADAGLTRTLMRLETAVGGTAAGFAMGGPLGAAIGLGSGLVLGHIINKVEKKSGTDKEIAQGITDAVAYAKQDNYYTEKPGPHQGDPPKTMYEGFRDGIEGIATGTAAGMREGFKAGFAGGKGAVDGFVEGAKGIVSGIIGGVTGK